MITIGKAYIFFYQMRITNIIMNFSIYNFFFVKNHIGKAYIFIYFSKKYLSDL
jgi:hypothetical protein